MLATAPNPRPKPTSQDSLTTSLNASSASPTGSICSKSPQDIFVPSLRGIAFFALTALRVRTNIRLNPSVGSTAANTYNAVITQIMIGVYR